MKIAMRRPKSFIYQYCFLCVLIGCAESSMNAHLMQSKEKDIKPIRTVKIKAEADVLQTGEAEALDGDVCPTTENVSEAIEEYKMHVAETQALLVAIQNDWDAEQRRVDKQIAIWNRNAKILNSRNDARLNNCFLLTGANGHAVNSELPMALKNLKCSGAWLDRAVTSAENQKYKDASKCILAARKATQRAEKLVTRCERLLKQ